MKKTFERVLKITFWLLPLALAMYIVQSGTRFEIHEGPDLARISKTLESKIDDLSMLPGVLGAGVVMADLKNNERMMLTYNVNDREAMWMFRQLALSHGVRVPLFNLGGPNTLHLLDVMNGGNYCFDFKDTVMASQMPPLKEKIKSACLFGMPFINAQFRHYILFFTNKPMTLDDFVQHEHLIDQTKQILFLGWINA